MMLKDQAEEVVPEAQVYRQFTGDLPIVVYIAAVIVLAVVRKGDVGQVHVARASDERHSAHARSDRRKKEIRSPGVATIETRDFGVIAVVVKFSARPGWLQRRELDVLPFNSHFERMLAVDLRDAVGELERRSDFVRRQEGVTAERGQSIDSKGGKPAVQSHLRDVLNAKLRGNVRQVVGGRRNACRVKVIEPRTNFINQSRRKRVCVANRSLLSDRGLISLLETAAIRYAAENAGNKLRIIHQAEAEEKLVLLVEVDVHPGIEGIAVFIQLWGITEVIEKLAQAIACG